MSSRDKQIKELEERNGELAKEILLNESAVFETLKEIADLDSDILDHPKIQQYVNHL